MLFSKRHEKSNILKNLFCLALVLFLLVTQSNNNKSFRSFPINTTESEKEESEKEIIDDRFGKDKSETIKKLRKLIASSTLLANHLISQTQFLHLQSWLILFKTFFAKGNAYAFVALPLYLIFHSLVFYEV